MIYVNCSGDSGSRRKREEFALMRAEPPETRSRPFVSSAIFFDLQCEGWVQMSGAGRGGERNREIESKGEKSSNETHAVDDGQWNWKTTPPLPLSFSDVAHRTAPVSEVIFFI